MLVQLLFFPGCPHVDAARGTLARALREVDDPSPIHEVDVTDPRTPPELRSWGSPTILIDGVDVAGGEASGSCCRLYPTSEVPGAPSLTLIETALFRAARRHPMGRAMPEVEVMEAKQHWDDVYRRKGAERVSWFQPQLTMSLRMIDEIGLPASAGIIDVGGGASTLVDDLIGRGFRDISVLDLSREALDITGRRLGDRGRGVTLIEADIVTAELPEARYDLWHDRAVFHFLTEEAARRRYIAAAERSLKPGGHLIVAAFGLSGPVQCSGLERSSHHR